MFTPQQIEQISFSRATFGGYDMQAVDEVLEPLTEDYITLYKENALLKSKMRVLVGKLEEYRKNEASMKDAIVNAQKTCDLMVKEAEGKCSQMLTEANLAAAENAKNARASIAEENARVEEARRAAAAQIDELEAQLRGCIEHLEQIKQASPPAASMEQPAADPLASEPDQAETVVDEISQNLEAMIGTTEDPAETPAPNHPEAAPTAKFENLRFGPKYNPTR